MPNGTPVDSRLGSQSVQLFLFLCFIVFFLCVDFRYIVRFISQHKERLTWSTNRTVMAFCISVGCLVTSEYKRVKGLALY